MQIHFPLSQAETMVEANVCTQQYKHFKSRYMDLKSIQAEVGFPETCVNHLYS